MKYAIFCISVIVFFFSTSCNRSHKNQLNFSVKNLPPENTTIKRYGKALFELDTNSFLDGLNRIRPDFLAFLDADFEDSANLNKIYNFVTDTQLIALYRQTLRLYPDLQQLENELNLSFRRMQYHFPGRNLPQVYTYVSGVNIEQPVFTDGTIAVIGLDCYLGPDEPLYLRYGIPQYILQRMSRRHILPDLFKSIFNAQIMPYNQSKNILDEMIKAGKMYYFMEAMQPKQEDHILIGYTAAQLQWVRNYEKDVWAFLVGDQVLYSSEFHLFRKLFGDGPFTQDFSVEAPARLGEYIGWQIVRSFMRHNTETSLPELLLMDDSQQLLAASRYRPRK